MKLFFDSVYFGNFSTVPYALNLHHMYSTITLTAIL